MRTLVAIGCSLLLLACKGPAAPGGPPPPCDNCTPDGGSTDGGDGGVTVTPDGGIDHPHDDGGTPLP